MIMVREFIDSAVFCCNFLASVSC